MDFSPSACRPRRQRTLPDDPGACPWRCHGTYARDLAARKVQGVTTAADPVYGSALDEAGLDRQPCAVHRPRTVGGPIRGIDEEVTHWDRVLRPILRRRARARPPEAGPVLWALWEAVMQGRVRLPPEVRKRLWHLVERGHERVRSQGHPTVPASSPGSASRGGGRPRRVPSTLCA